MLADDGDNQIFRFGGLLLRKLRLVRIQILLKFQIEIGIECKAILSLLPIFGFDGRQP